MKRISRNNISFNVDFHNNYCVDFWQKYESGEWEPGTTKIFLDYLDAESVAVDVGAEIGATTLFMAKICKAVVSIEPSLLGIEIIKHSLSLNKDLKNKVNLLHGCLADTNEERLYGKNSELFNDIHFVNQPGGYKVKSFTIEDIAKKEKKSIDFIKIDIEGGEYIVLPAMKNFLKIYKPTLLISIHPGFIRGQWHNIFGKFRNILLRYVDNFKLYRSIYGYKYYYDVEERKSISLLRLFTFRYIRGNSASECQILATNKHWGKIRV